MSAKCRSILIVEDEEDIRDALKQILELEGYTVFTAENGLEGIEKLKSIPNPCLVLLDLMMPVMNGWQFIEALGNNTLASIPVVIISAYIAEAKNVRSHGFIKKPINLEELFTFVKTYCDESSF